MSIMITDECINCGACESECSNNAIYQNGVNWDFGGQYYDSDEGSPSGATEFFSTDHYYIVPDKCTECVGFHDEPQCIAVCPVDCCIPDPKHVEKKDQLLAKKEKLDMVGR